MGWLIQKPMHMYFIPIFKQHSIIFPNPMQAKQKHNPYRIPSSPTLALEHRKASTPSLPSTDPNSTHQLCACCLQPVQCQPLPINFGMEDIRHLGCQYQGMYRFVKMLGVVLAVVLVDCGLGQFQDIVGKGEGSEGMFGTNWTALGAGYPHEKFWLYSTLSFISLTFLLILARLYQSHQPPFPQPQPQPKASPQHYSILLKNIPKSLNASQKIQDLFKSNFNSLHIKEIILIPDMQRYREVRGEIEREVDNWRLLLRSQDKKKEEVLGALRNVEAGHRKLGELRDEMASKKNQYFSGNAIVTFQSHENQQEVLKAWHKKFFTKNKVQASFGQVILGDRDIIIAEQAPSPTQINWQNISLSDAEYRAKIRFNYLLVFIVQVVMFLGYFVGQLVVGRRIGGSQGESVGTVCTLVFMSILSYSALPKTLQLLTKNQRPPTQTASHSQLTSKLTLSLLLLHSLTLLAAESIFTPAPSLASTMLNKAIILAFADFFVGTLYWLANFEDLGKRIVGRFWAGRERLTQQEANLLAERPGHFVEGKIGVLLCGFLTSIMYSNLAPIILVIQLGIVLSFYWIDKLNLSRRSSTSPKKISPSYLQSLPPILQLSLILKPLTNLLLWSIAHESNNIAIQQIVMLVVGIAFNVGPKQKLIGGVMRKVFGGQRKEEQGMGPYEEGKMDSLYRIQSPIYGGLKEKLVFLESQGGFKAKINVEGSQLKSGIDVSDTIQDRLHINPHPNPKPSPNPIEQANEQQPMQKNLSTAYKPESEGQPQKDPQSTQRNMLDN